MKKRLRFRGVQQSQSRCSRGLCGRVREVKRKWTGKRRTKGYKSVSRQERINLTVWVVTRKEGSEALLELRSCLGGARAMVRF